MKKILAILIFILSIEVSLSQTWKPYGIGFTPNYISDLIIFNNELYVCGGIANSGATTLNGIARWDGANWNALATGANFGGPFAMSMFNNDLIAGGFFTNMSGVPNTRSIARWDGTNWHALHYGVTSGTVRAMAEYNGSLYVGGNFTQVDSIPMRNMAKWDGSSWSLPCTIPAGLTTIWSMAVFNNELYIGGYFSTVNSIPVYNIAKFDGTTWSGVGGGVNSDVMALYPDTLNNRLYAVGNFSLAAGGAVLCPSNVAYWDGANWFSVGNGPSFYPRAVSKYKDELYIDAGNDTIITPSNDTINFIARWNGAEWKALGKGVNCSVHALMEFNNELAVGGCFTQAGDTAANLIARWDYTPNSLQENNKEKEEIKIIPNPFNNSATVGLPEIFKKYFPCTFKLFDVAGKEALEIKNISSLNFTISKAALGKGVYFYMLLSKEEEITNGKVVIE